MDTIESMVGMKRRLLGEENGEDGGKKKKGPMEVSPFPLIQQQWLLGSIAKSHEFFKLSMTQPSATK